MKEYKKPVLQVREIRVMENLAANTPAGAKLNWVNSIPTTVYNLATFSASGKAEPTTAPTEP